MNNLNIILPRIKIKAKVGTYSCLSRDILGSISTQSFNGNGLFVANINVLATWVEEPIETGESRPANERVILGLWRLAPCLKLGGVSVRGLAVSWAIGWVSVR